MVDVLIGRVLVDQSIRQIVNKLRRELLRGGVVDCLEDRVVKIFVVVADQSQLGVGDELFERDDPRMVELDEPRTIVENGQKKIRVRLKVIGVNRTGREDIIQRCKS